MQDIKIIAERLLGRKLIKTEGLKASDLDLTESRVGYTLPKCLKNLYLLVGKNTLLMESFNYFALPSQLEIINNKILFLEENQGSCYWGFEPGEDNPWVYQSPYGEEWHPENMRMDDFLSTILYYQCAQGYEYAGNANISDEDLEIFTHTEWEEVVHNNGLQIYWKPNCLLWYFYNEQNIIDDIYFSTRTENAFQQNLNKYNLTKFFPDSQK